MSTNFAKTLVWKHEYDVKLWRHKNTTPETNDHHMPLNETPPMKIFCARHWQCWLTECQTGAFWLTDRDAGTKPLNQDCPGWNGTYGMPNYAYSSTRILLILCVIALNIIINYQHSKGEKHTHHYVRANYNSKIRLRECLVEYQQSSIGVRLDWLAPRASEGGQRGALTPWILKFSAKKGCFLSFEREKSNFTTFGPPGKILEKSPSAPPWKKSFRAHGWRTHGFARLNLAKLHKNWECA